MNCRGRSFLVIMIIIAVSALFLRSAIDQLIKFHITQNESYAKMVLNSISTALDNYSRDKKGVFPENLSVLTLTTPPYLSKSYVTQSSIRGYYFACPRLDPSGYQCVATPLICNLTGKRMFTVTTGGALVPEDCLKKD